jgi:hypothetical protein
MVEDQTKEEMLANLNWLTTQNRNLLNRMNQLEGILNAVQEQSPEALSFLQAPPPSEEVGSEVRAGEEPADESEKEEEEKT